jgi:hypothetical protein
MSARQEILRNGHDIAALKGKVPASQLVDKLFENVVDYASQNWDYAAQPGAQSAEDLLAGTGRKSVACATLRTALKLMIKEDVGDAAVESTDLNDYFVTKLGLKCFDPKVHGNIGNHGSNVYNLGCHFSTHYFLKSFGK